jgi:hypothetical protein
MVTREQVLRLVEDGRDYEEAGRLLAISPGLAYMIATGLPADGGDTLASGETQRPGFVSGSTQHLANRVEPENPTRKESVLAWVRSRAHADAQMAEAAAARTAEPGPPKAEDEDQDLVTVLTRDHDAVTALVEQLSAIPGHKTGGSSAQIERRKSIVDMITVALSKHESAEEELFWPNVRKKVENGDNLASQGTQQEQEATETLMALARSDADSDEFDELVEQLVMQMRKHVSFEDRVLLAFREAVPDDERTKLGRKLRSAEGRAPTRAHPHAPRKSGKAAKAAATPAAAMDKMRDAAGDRPAERKGKEER